MFRRKNYSKRALSTFEIISSFVVNLYYNNFYEEAKRLHTSGKVDSITDGYKHSVNAYLKSLDNPKLYRKTIVGIHRYYSATTRFTTITFSDCVDEIVKQFVPPDFFSSTSHKQKDGILRKVLVSAIRQFSADVLCSQLLGAIIDNHKSKNLIRIMQNKMVEALMFEREKLFRDFFAETAKSTQSSGVPINNHMKKQIISLVKKNHYLSSQNKKLKDCAIKLLGEVKRLQTEQKESRPYKNEQEERYVQSRYDDKINEYNAVRKRYRGEEYYDKRNERNEHRYKEEDRGYEYERQKEFDREKQVKKDLADERMRNERYERKHSRDPIRNDSDFVRGDDMVSSRFQSPKQVSFSPAQENIEIAHVNTYDEYERDLPREEILLNNKEHSNKPSVQEEESDHSISEESRGQEKSENNKSTVIESIGFGESDENFF